MPAGGGGYVYGCIAANCLSTGRCGGDVLGVARFDIFGVEYEYFSGSLVHACGCELADSVLAFWDNFSPISDVLALFSSSEAALDLACTEASSSEASVTVGCIRAIIDCVNERVRDLEEDLGAAECPCDLTLDR